MTGKAEDSHDEDDVINTCADMNSYHLLICELIILSVLIIFASQIYTN